MLASMLTRDWIELVVGPIMVALIMGGPTWFQIRKSVGKPNGRGAANRMLEHLVTEVEGLREDLRDHIKDPYAHDEADGDEEG